ncbi:MAG: 30S ribosomal protein S5 [Patescibacteria group bacterium]
MRRKLPEVKDQEFEQKIVDLARVTRVMAGGKRMRFRACVVIGNGKGKVAYGVAKGADVSISINKAVTQAKKDIKKVMIVDDTIPHEVNIKFKAARLMLRPAPAGTGVIAGGAVRTVMELAGVKNIVTKMIGSKNKINNVKATFLALASLIGKERLEERKKK